MVEHHINGTSTLHHITTDIADQAYITISIDKDLQVHHITQFLIVKCHNALEDNHGFRFHMNGLRQTVGEHIRIGGLFDGLAILQLLDLFRQQFPVEGVWVVEIDGLALLISQGGGIVIIRVQRDNGCTMGRQCFCNTLDDGGLARARATCYSYDDHFCSLIK